MDKDKDIQDLTPDERTMRVLKSVDDMLIKFGEQEHVKVAINTGTIPPNALDHKLTLHIINSLRWITGVIEPCTADKFIDSGNFEHGEIMKNLLRENMFNVRMYN